MSPAVFMRSIIGQRDFIAFGSVGETISNTQARIVSIEDPRGPLLPPNTPGELLVRGPQMMLGYHNQPPDTDFIDGWFKTGDVAYYDKNKMLYMTDRLKEMIKVKGYQVAPAELEAILRSHPNISDAAVIGIAHAIHGEVPKAFIVPKSKSINIQHIHEFVASKVAPYKKLVGGISIVNDIPKNAAGKILRRQLKEHFVKK
jgi:4-coumarate--CoA ligase